MSGRDSPPPDESDHEEAEDDYTAGAEAEDEAEDEALEDEGHDSMEHGDRMIAYEHSRPEAMITRTVRKPPMPPPNYNANAGSASIGETTWAPGHRSSRVNQIINRMEAEGRALMTEEEVQALNADFEAAPLEKNASLSCEALFEEGMEEADEAATVDEAEATASTDPTPVRHTTPQPKPRGNNFRKWPPQLSHLSKWNQTITRITCYYCWDLPYAPDCACIHCDCKGESVTHEKGIQFRSSQVAGSWLWQQSFPLSQTGVTWSWPAVLRIFMFTRLRAMLENVSLHPVHLCTIGLWIFYSGLFILVLVRCSTSFFDITGAGTLQALQHVRNYMAAVLCVCGLGQKYQKTVLVLLQKLSVQSTVIHNMSGPRNTSASRTGPKSGRTCRQARCSAIYHHRFHVHFLMPRCEGWWSGCYATWSLFGGEAKRHSRGQRAYP